MEISRRQVGLLVWDGVELLDFAGPGQVFAVAGGHFEVVTVAASTTPVTSQGFLSIHPEHDFESCPRLDVLVIPGGDTDVACRDEALLEFVRNRADTAEVVLSVCTGALILAAAGLLDGLEVTTWHGAIERLRAAAPLATVVEGQRWIDSGKIVTTAGVTAGIDGSLHVVARLAGQKAAAAVAHYIELNHTGRLA